MAEPTLSQIGVDDLELIEAIRITIKAFEQRKMTKVVEKITYSYTETGPINYDIKIRDLTTPVQLS